MWWKLLLSLATIFLHNGHKNSEQQHYEFVPSATGPLTLEEEAIARKALDGEYFGGDMVLPDHWNITDAGIRNPLLRWPGYPGGGVVPYVIDDSVLFFKDLIDLAMEQYHNQTCIKFVERTNESDFIRIFYGKGCWSKVGKIGGLQDLSLGNGCAYIGVIVHQLGHAIGLFHEHQRSDRDKYITVIRNNIIEGKEDKFERIDADKELNFNTAYDYDSIMHYGNFAFSIQPGGLPTILAKDERLLKEIYEKANLTQSDITTIKELYKCKS